MKKFAHSDARKVFFTSDLHYNHSLEAVWKDRGFSSIQEHNLNIIQKINHRVRKDDILFSLGDLTLNCPVDELYNLLNSINCQNLYLLWGNHPNPLLKLYFKDLGLEYPKLADERQFIYPFKLKTPPLDKITVLGDYDEILVNGHYIILSHYPIDIWNQMSKGSFCLSGHSHYNDKRRHTDTLDNGRCLDVGWDGKKDVYSFDEIQNIMSKKEFKTKDHHILNHDHKLVTVKGIKIEDTPQKIGDIVNDNFWKLI